MSTPTTTFVAYEVVTLMGYANVTSTLTPLKDYPRVTCDHGRACQGVGAVETMQGMTR